MREGNVFDLNAFRNREEALITERLGQTDRPEMRGVSVDTVTERLIEIGREVILTTRLAAELGEEVDPKLLQAVTQIRNMTMRTLDFISPEYAERAEDWATADWSEATGTSLDPEKLDDESADRVREQVKSQIEAGGK